ncbi:MAG: cytochrome c [Polyangiaceae bacterium]|nr:cytochrome c [Polyangiaceae bacterium]
MARLRARKTPDHPKAAASGPCPTPGALRGVTFAVALVLSTQPANADIPESSDTEAHRLVHWIGYVAADYPSAVEHGKVLNWDEYEEQLELVEHADQLATKLELVAARDGRLVNLRAPTADLREKVEIRAAHADILSAVHVISDEACAAFNVETAPKQAPNALRGEALYQEHCTSCHGITGHADTPRAAGLTPRPLNFHDPARGGELSPFKVATTVRFGVPDTAMVPFTFLADADRWDIAFYVLKLRHATVETVPAPVTSIQKLAVSSDRTLREQLAADHTPPEQVLPKLADLRMRAAFDVTTPLATPVAAPLDPTRSPIRLAFLPYLTLATVAALLAYTMRTRASKPSQRLFQMLSIAAVLSGAYAVFVLWRGQGAQSSTQPPPQESTFHLTVQVRAPAPIKQGTVRLLSPSFDETVRFGPNNSAVFTNLPSELKKSGATLTILTVPEFEATWEPARVFPLLRNVLEVRMKPEKSRFDVVLLRDSNPPQALHLEGFHLGEEVNVATFISRAVAGLAVRHANLPAPTQLSCLSVNTGRWLKPTTSLEHLDLNETSILLVDEGLRTRLGNSPETYLPMFEAAHAPPTHSR